MQAFREIRDVTTETVTIALPIEFRHHRVEIIVLPLEESLQKHEAQWPEKFFATVRATGANLVAGRAYPDHHSYSTV